MADIRLSLFFRFCFFSSFSVFLVTATDHIVGANKGWNPGINYTLWANNQTFYVNDMISFRYQKTMYNVFRVNESGYVNCTIEGALGNWTSGKDFVLLDKPIRYYFICNNFCQNGMKVSVLVHHLPSPPAASTSLKSKLKENASEVILRPRSALLRSFLVIMAVSFAWI